MIPESIITQAREIVARYRAQAPEGFDPQGKGGPSASQEASAKASQRLAEEQLRKLKSEKPIEMPQFKIPEPVRIAPSPTSSASDEERGAMDLQRQLRRRRGMAASNIAGNTGGYGGKLGGPSKV